MIRNRFAAALMLMTFFGIPLLAQPGPPGPRRPMTEEDIKARVESLADSLQMTPDQKQKVLDIELEFHKNMQAERERSAGDREAMRAFFMEQQEKRDASYAEVLTPEQMKKYREMMDRRRQQFQQRRDQAPGGGRGRGGR